MNYINLIISNNSILRNLQIDEFKNFKLSGDCIEFGSNKKLSRNFLKKDAKNYNSVFSNMFKYKDFVKIDIEKKIIHKKKYDFIIIFNVLEHISNLDYSIKNLYSLLKKNGKIIGSTPFLYRVHGAPKDYNRFTKQYLQKILKENNFKNIKIKELGIGPLLACISLLRGYIKYIPLISHFLVITAILIDKLLCFVSKKMLNEIYPIGYIFSAKK